MFVSICQISREFADLSPLRNFDGSQFDVFETLDLETSSGLTGMFTDASFSGSQFLFDNPDRVHQI